MPDTGRGYPYPASTDHARLWEHVEDLATAVDTDVDELVTPDVTTTTATVGTVESGFTVLDVRAAALLGGKLIHIDLYCDRSGATVTATTSNIPDTPMFQLAVAYRPDHVVSTVWSNGITDGEAIIQTDGLVYLRTSSQSITSGTDIRLSATYIKA